MQRAFVHTALVIALVLCCASMQQPQNPPAKGIAVVELFTSEGCSSCPPADDALMQLAQQNPNDSHLLVLSFHVDYWNRLGWKDPYSSSRWSDRQRIYSAHTNDNIYTPQCIVNGTKSFVGSEARTLNEAVRAAKRSATLVEVSATYAHEQISYAITGDLTGAELNIAVVESGLRSHVRSGENKGRELSHTHVVRSLRTIPLNETARSGKVTIDEQSVIDRNEARIILYVQRAGQGAVIGGSKLSLR
jgi:hypothetical protein